MLFFKDRLRVEGLLGEGLNAKVYKVTKSSKAFGVEQTYALKVLKRKEDLEHFKKELQNLNQAQGKHIVRHYGWTQHGSFPALLLEYIDGISLFELLKGEALTSEESLWIYQEIQSGIQELNSSSLFHGDLSPRNILISKKGEIKLIDFGLSHWRSQKIETTLEFASPKVLYGADSDLESDLYSLDKIQNLLGIKSGAFSAAHRKQNEQIHLRQAPESLVQKISDIFLLQSCQTQEFSNEQASPPNKRPLSLFFSGLGLLSFLLLPYYFTSNQLIKNIQLEVRSSSGWLAIKKEASDPWCYAPCILEFKKTGPNIFYWKNAQQRGQKTILLSSPHSILNIKDAKL